jgi:hypothetical protein
MLAKHISARGVRFLLVAVAAAAVGPVWMVVHAADDVRPRQDPAVLALVHTVGTNEFEALKSRNAIALGGNGPRYFYYETERSQHTGQHLWAQAVVETTAGPLERLLAIDGKPLDERAQRAEDARVNDLAAHPEKIKAQQTAKMADRKRAESLFTTPPELFEFTRESAPEGTIAVAFAPNPTYVPQTYVQRVLHVMTGVVDVDARTMRLRELDARISQQVQFGWGLLGTVEQGGTLRMVRQPVGSGEWRLVGLDIKVQGRMLLFKSMDMDEHLQRRDFIELPAEETMQEDVRRVMAAKL